MANEKRLIDANALYAKLGKMAREPYYQHDGEDYYVGIADASGEIAEAPTVDAVEVALIKEFMQKILETLDIIKATDEELATFESQNAYYRGKVDAFEISRRLVNAALTDLCDQCGAKMDGGNEDGN